MKEEIKEICTELNDGKIAVVQATEKLLDLFSVSQQRELLNSFMDYLQESENDGETVVDRQAFINGFLETI